MPLPWLELSVVLLDSRAVVHSVIHLCYLHSSTHLCAELSLVSSSNASWARYQHQHLLLCFRFSTTLLGSRAVVGSLVQPSNLLLQQGQEGLSVEQALRQSGFDPSVEAVQAIAMKPEQV